MAMKQVLPLLPFCALGVALACAPAAQAQTQTAAKAEEAKDKPWRLGAAVGAPDWLKLSGSVRPRYETLANQFVAGRTGDDEFFGIQTLLKAEIDTGGIIIIGGELLDSRRILGNAGGSTPGEVDTLEPAQLYLAWRPKNFLMDGATLDFTAGRFTMDVGSRRLIARSGYRSIFSEFDGLRAVWTGSNSMKVTGFYTAPTSRQPSDTPSALDNEAALNERLDRTRFSGLHVETPLLESVVGDVYLFDLDEDDASDAPTRNRDLSTLGVRLKRAPKTATWDFDLEYAHQTGTVRATTSPADITDLDHDASMLHAEAGWTLDAPWSPRISLHYDMATGDNSPSDLSSERFDPLFGDRSFEFGPTSIYGAILRANVDSPGVRAEVKPDKLSDALVMVRQVTLDKPRDSFANSGVRDATGASGDDVGLQTEIRYRRWLIPDSVRLSIGGAALTRGDFLKTAPNATRTGDAIYGYTELTFGF